MNEHMGMQEEITKSVGRSLTEQHGMKGWFEINHIRDGQVIDTRNTPNTIVNAGLASAAGLLNGEVTDFFDYLAIGTGTTSPAATDTQLETEITTGGGGRASSTNSQVTTIVANDTAQFVHQWDFTASLAITESGIFDSSTAGSMLARQTFSAINVNNGDSLQITWKVQCS